MNSVVHLAGHRRRHAAGDPWSGVAGRLRRQVVGIRVQDHGVADHRAVARRDRDRVRRERLVHVAARIGGHVAEVAGVMRHRAALLGVPEDRGGEDPLIVRRPGPVATAGPRRVGSEVKCAVDRRRSVR
jgi:hypothetical protein